MKKVIEPPFLYYKEQLHFTEMEVNGGKYLSSRELA